MDAKPWPPAPRLVLNPRLAEHAIAMGWVRAEDVIVSLPLPAALAPSPVLAATDTDQTGREDALNIPERARRMGIPRSKASDEQIDLITGRRLSADTTPTGRADAHEDEEK